MDKNGNSKLIEAKEWVTILQAAKSLSKVLRDEISEADVLQFALEGKLNMSIYLVEAISSRYGKLVRPKEADHEEYTPKQYENEENPPKFIHVFSPEYDRNTYFMADPYNENSYDRITGVWDLPLKGRAREELESWHQKLRDWPPRPIRTRNGFFLKDENGRICMSKEKNLLKKHKVVVRTKALKEFQKRPFVKDKTEIEQGCQDTAHQFYANELSIAVEAWTELYDKNPPQTVPPGGHKKYIRDWLEDNYPDLGKNAIGWISTVINPNKKGGFRWFLLPNRSF